MKTCKVSKGSAEIVGEFARTRFILPIHFCGIRAIKSLTQKCEKIFQESNKTLQIILKARVKFRKDKPKTVEGIARTCANSLYTSVVFRLERV